MTHPHSVRSGDAPDESLPRWCRRLIAEFHAEDDRAVAVTNGLTPEQLNWKRVPTEWSIGQCLEHLQVGNDLYCRALSESLTGQEGHAVQEITPGWLGKFFLTYFIEPSPKTIRVRAPKKVTPRSEVDRSIVDGFLATNAAARDIAYRARNLDVNRVRFVNPFFPVVRFTVGTGLEVLSQHNLRHLIQAEKVRASMAGAS